MTKQEILDEFSDINFAYNNSSKHETLSWMLDELLKEQEVVRCKDCKHHLECDYWLENGDDWYCANGERR